MELKLKDFLKTIDADEEVCIGSGSNFLYIGKNSDYMSNDAEINEKLYQELYKNLKKDYSRLKCLNKLATLTEHELKEKKSVESRIAQRSTCIAGYVRICNREVTDAYCSTCGNGQIVIVEGDEVGGYWFKSEYEEGMENERRRKGIF